MHISSSTASRFFSFQRTKQEQRFNPPLISRCVHVFIVPSPFSHTFPTLCGERGSVGVTDAGGTLGKPFSFGVALVHNFTASQQKLWSVGKNRTKRKKPCHLQNCCSNYLTPLLNNPPPLTVPHLPPPPPSHKNLPPLLPPFPPPHPTLPRSSLIPLVVN